MVWHQPECRGPVASSIDKRGETFLLKNQLQRIAWQTAKVETIEGF
jgi:hypothetical protein